MHAITANHPSVAIEGALLAIRLFLAMVIAIAGIAKLRDRHGTAQMLRDFGAPTPASTAGAWALPITELMIAIVIVPSATTQIGSVAAASLLAIFTAVILYNLASGRWPECRCFGQMLSAPIGTSTAVRNATLTVLAVAVVAGGSGRHDAVVLAWVRSHWIFVALAVGIFGFCAIQLLLLMQLVAQQGRVLLRLDSIEQIRSAATAGVRAPAAAAPSAGLPVGKPAPDFELPTPSGDLLGLKQLLGSGRRAALIFVHVNCGPCAVLLPEIAQWQINFDHRLMIALITEGSAAAIRDLLAPYKIGSVLLQREHEVADAFQAYGTPAAVMIESDGTIGSGLAMGADAIRMLVTTLAAHQTDLRRNGSGTADREGRAMHSALAIGQTAPEFSARGFRGETVQLAQYLGREVIVLFWNPQCGFCRQTVNDLISLSAAAKAHLLVASTAKDDNLATRTFQGTVVLDETSRIAKLFGASGTPMAVRVGADGRITSTLAAGKDAVIGLLRQ